MSGFIAPTIAPPPRPLGVIGSLRAARRNVLSILPEIAFTQPIVTGTTGPARWHMLQSPEGMRRVFLDNHENYPKSEVMIRMLRPAVGRSLFTAEGEAWRWQRRAIAPVFSARNVEALAPLMRATAERTASALARAHGRPRPMVQAMLGATFDVICEVALSGRDAFDVDAYAAAITRYFLTIGRASLLDFLRLPPWFPRPGELLGAGAVRKMHAMVRAAIERRRREGPGAAPDLLDHMLAARDPQSGTAMSPRDLLHNMQFFIVAGHETTALTLAWALLLLAHDPASQEAAAAQARARLGADGGAPRIADAADLKAMPLIDAILQETMRLYPPVGMLARDVRAPDRLHGREIRPGDTLFLPLYALHRHRLYWEAPDAFRPERFLPEAARGRDRFLHLPFGAGPRICVGANFAMLQAGIILSTLLARFRFAPSGAPLPEPVMHMTIRPSPEVLLKVAPR